MPYQRITNFTGGLNTLVDPRRLSPNSDKEGTAESPEMENMDITKEGALITSTGFERVTSLADIGNLVGQWKFEEGSGTTTIDHSASGNDGTLINTPTWSTSGISGNALDFDRASTEYVQVGDVSELRFERTDTFSFSAWFKATDTAGTAAPILSKMGPTATFPGYSVQLDGNGRVQVLLSSDFGGGNYILSINSTGLDDDAWHHVVVTYDGSSTLAGLLVYVDNVLTAADGASVDNLSASIATGADFEIGARVNTAGYMDGLIDEVMVFSDVLTTDEIATLFNNPGVSTTNPTGSTKVKALLNYEKDEDSRFLIATIGQEHYSITASTTELSNLYLGDYGNEATYVGGTVYMGSSSTRRAILGNDVAANTTQKADLSGAMAALAGAPPDGYIMTVFMGRLFVANGITLYYSNVEDEDDFAGGGTIKFNDLITGLLVEGERLIVFTRTYHQGVVFRYDDSFNLSVPLKEPYERKYGTLGYKTVQSVYPDVFYWSDEGVMRLGAEAGYDSDGVPRPQSVSRKIDPALDLANKNFRIDSAAAQFKQQYLLSIPVGTDNFNSKTYVYNLNWKAWTLRTGFYPTSYALFRDSNYKQELYFGNFFAPEIYKFNDSYSYGGFGYTRRWKSKKFVHGDHNIMKKWRWIDITGSMDASTTFDVTIQVDNNKKKYQIDNTHLEIDAFGEYIGDNFLGDAFLGGAEPEEARFKRFRARIPVNSDIREGYEMQLTLENSEDEQPWKIDFIGIEYDYLPRTQILSKYLNNNPLST